MLCCVLDYKEENLGFECTCRAGDLACCTQQQCFPCVSHHLSLNQAVAHSAPHHRIRSPSSKYLRESLLRVHRGIMRIERREMRLAGKCLPRA